MGWIIFFIYLFLGIVANVCIHSDKETTQAIRRREKISRSRTATAVEIEKSKMEIEQLKKDKKTSEMGWKVVMWIGVSVLFVGLCYVIGLIWYYFCCGFLVIEEPNFFFKIFYGFMSIVCLVLALGAIAELFGWRPWNKK